MQLKTIQRKAIEQRITRDVGWPPQQYQLEQLCAWGDDVVLLAAVPNVHLPEHPVLALMPQNTVIVSNADEDALTVLLCDHLSEYVEDMSAEELAKLAVMFHQLPEPIGQLYQRSFDGLIAQRVLPRLSPLAHKVQYGSMLQVIFYTFHQELEAFYDCLLTVRQKSAHFEARQLQRHSTVVRHV